MIEHGGMNPGHSTYRDRAFADYHQTQVCANPPQLMTGLQSRLPYLNKIIGRWVPPQKEQSILDIGCGYGGFIWALKARGYSKLQGLDLSGDQVEAARALGLTEVRKADFMVELKAMSDKSWDVVILFDVLEHQPKEVLLTWLDEICRIIKPGGRLILHVPNGESIFSGRMRYADITHEIAFTTQSLRQLGQLSGFKEFYFDEDEPVPHGFISAIRWVLWRVIRLPLRFIHMVETGDVGRDLILTQNLLSVFIR